MILEFPGWSEMSAWAITFAIQSMRMANGRIGTKHRLQSSLPRRRKSDEEVVDRSVVRILPKSVLVGIQLSVWAGIVAGFPDRRTLFGLETSLIRNLSKLDGRRYCRVRVDLGSQREDARFSV